MRRDLLVLAILVFAGAARAQPLTLDDALREAARANPDLGLAQADAQAAGADVTAAWSGLLPRLDLTTSFGHIYNGAQPLQDANTGKVLNETLPASDSQAYLLKLEVRQPLFDGLKTVRQVSGANALQRAAVLLLDETRNGVEFQVIQRFYDLVKQERALAVLDATARRSEELVARADALYAAGKAPKSDTIQARVNLGNDRVNVEVQRIRVAQSRSALAQTLGRTSGDPVQVVSPSALDEAVAAGVEPPPLQDLLARGQQRRPALGAEAARVEAAQVAVGAARADLWPSLAAVGSYSRQGPELARTDGVYGDPSRTYVALGQLVLSWNLFAGRQTAAAIQKAEATAARSVASRERTAAQVSKEIADARAAVVALAREVALAQENLSAAEQGNKLARERLDAGLLSQLEARDASLKLTNAQLALVQARIDHAVAAADLARAVGGAL